MRTRRCVYVFLVIYIIIFIFIFIFNELDLSTEPNEIILNGDEFTLVIDVKNTSKRKLTVNLTGVISTILYTGEVKTLIKRQEFEGIKIDAGKSK